MAILKCKMCGGDLVLTPGSTIAECEYCGTTQTVPSADNEKKLTLFERANRLRAACEFDKAAGVYESIVADFPTEAEGYWGLVLCKYGIEYVDDPATGRKIPTCHRSSFESVMEDPNFEQTMENADALSLKVYREEAKRFEEIRKGIIEVSSKEDPYDIFICYKETDEKGDRTVDSLIAQNIYDSLTEKGYRVFFSRITLEDKLGVAYEPYIFAALNSAKVMLAVGTTYEYYNAVWVKNEWSRFLKLMAKDTSKHLIPCYKDIDAYDIPKEFAHLQAQDMGKVGAMADLVRGVEKLINAPKLEVKSSGMQSDDVNRIYVYNSALDEMKKKKVRDIKEAVKKLESLGDWSDAPEQLALAKKNLKKAKRRRSIKRFIFLGIPLILLLCLLGWVAKELHTDYHSNYSKAETYLENGEYDKAATYFQYAQNNTLFGLGDADKRKAEANELADQAAEKLAQLQIGDPSTGDGMSVYFTREYFEHMMSTGEFKEFELMLYPDGNGFSGDYQDVRDDSWWVVSISYQLEEDTFIFNIPDKDESTPFTVAADGSIHLSDGRQFIPIGILAEEVYNEALSLYNAGQYAECYEFMQTRWFVVDVYGSIGTDRSNEFVERWMQLDSDAWAMS